MEINKTLTEGMNFRFTKESTYKGKGKTFEKPIYELVLL